MSSKGLDIYMVYEFIRRLSIPFAETKAFKLGLIDAKGKRLRKAKSREEKSAVTYYDRLIFNLKRLLRKAGFESKVATFTASLFLLREFKYPTKRILEREMTNEFVQFIGSVEHNALLEEVAANATGSSVAGTGDDTVHWSNKQPKKVKSKKLTRRHILSSTI